MEIKGKVIFVGEIKTGTSQSSGKEWQSQEFVVEFTEGVYTKKASFTIHGGEKISRFNVELGEEVHVRFDINAREYNGKWFNQLTAYDVIIAQRPAETTVASPTPPPPPSEKEDDLPF